MTYAFIDNTDPLSVPLIAIRAVDLTPPDDAETVGEGIVARMNRFGRDWSAGEPERVAMRAMANDAFRAACNRGTWSWGDE